MSFLESMQTPYTTNKYDASKKIEPSKIQELKAILRLSPSSINSQPWKFTVVSSKLCNVFDFHCKLSLCMIIESFSMRINQTMEKE